MVSEALVNKVQFVLSILDDRTTIDISSVQKATIKWRFVDKEYGEFFKFYRSIKRYHQCQHPKRGVDSCISKLKRSDEYISSKLPLHIKLKPNTYDSKTNKAIFVDEEFGEFSANASNAMKNKTSHPKRAKINLKNSAAKRKLPIEEVKSRLPKNVTLDESTYVRVRKKCRFIDEKYGEFWAAPYRVFRGCSHPDGMVEKMKKTFMERYGVDNNMKSPDMAIKNARSRANTYIAKHWKTSKELVCQGSWEVLVVKWLNQNKHDFEWQKESIIFEDGSTYRPDLWFDGQIIDIKGYFTPQAQYKVEQARQLGHDIVLWDKSLLIKLKIIHANGKKNIIEANKYLQSSI